MKGTAIPAYFSVAVYNLNISLYVNQVEPYATYILFVVSPVCVFGIGYFLRIS